MVPVVNLIAKSAFWGGGECNTGEKLALNKVFRSPRGRVVPTSISGESPHIGTVPL